MLSGKYDSFVKGIDPGHPAEVTCPRNPEKIRPFFQP
jgi:hypothetical protein